MTARRLRGYDGLIHLEHRRGGLWCRGDIYARGTRLRAHRALTCLWCVAHRQRCDAWG